jgi:hypothetical protein
LKATAIYTRVDAVLIVEFEENGDDGKALMFKIPSWHRNGHETSELLYKARDRINKDE